MNWRKHIVLIVGGGIAVVLLVGALVMLFRFQGSYGVVNRELDAARSRLQQLMGRNPFPSAENIEKTRQNLDEAKGVALQLQDLLQRSQISGESMEPAEFAPLLERTSRRLMQRAQEFGVILPEGFAFGFSRYAAGELPTPESVPRLVAQLRAVEVLCDALFQAKVAQLDALSREAFDDIAGNNAEPVGMDSRRNTRRTATEEAPVISAVPPAETNELYSVERLMVEFQARETAAWDALNAIVRHPVFMAIADVRLENKLAAAGQLGKKQAVTPLGGDRGPGVAAQYPSHDDRVVAGRENVGVSLVIDLYHFHDAFAKEAKP